jgi:hypothetical protein
VKKAKTRLAKVHSTDAARRWFNVDFAVGGLGFNNDIACKLGAQVSQPFAHDVVISIMLGYRNALLSINRISCEPHFTGFAASMPSFFSCVFLTLLHTCSAQDHASSRHINDIMQYTLCKSRQI